MHFFQNMPIIASTDDEEVIVSWVDIYLQNKNGKINYFNNKMPYKTNIS